MHRSRDPRPSAHRRSRPSPDRLSERRRLRPAPRGVRRPVLRARPRRKAQHTGPGVELLWRYAEAADHHLVQAAVGRGVVPGDARCRRVERRGCPALHGLDRIAAHDERLAQVGRRSPRVFFSGERPLPFPRRAARHLRATWDARTGSPGPRHTATWSPGRAGPIPRCPRPRSAAPVSGRAGRSR